MDGVDLTPIWASIGIVGGFTTLVAGWVWLTRDKLGDKIEESTEKLRKELCNEISKTNDKLEALSLQQERNNTMIEPLWETLCESLPGILKMRNSPDVVDYMLNGSPTIRELDDFMSDIKNKLISAQDAGNDTRAMALTWLLVALRIRKGKLQITGVK